MGELGRLSKAPPTSPRAAAFLASARFMAMASRRLIAGLVGGGDGSREEAGLFRAGLRATAGFIAGDLGTGGLSGEGERRLPRDFEVARVRVAGRGAVGVLVVRVRGEDGWGMRDIVADREQRTSQWWSEAR